MREPTIARQQIDLDRTRQLTRRVSDLLVDMLVQSGVDTVFGLPGGPISTVHDALLDRDEIRHVTTKHESGAMFAAAGYARTTGKLGVAIVTSGPGVLNAMTGLASAHCDGLPVLLLVGEVPKKVHGRGALQDGSAYGLNIIAMASHISKLAAELNEPAQAPLMLKRAITTALSGRRGPVVLTIPMDVALAPLVAPRIASEITLQHSIPAQTLEEIALILELAQHPLILAGSGCRGAKAPERLIELAEKLSCPVATTPKAKGVFPEDHPLALGVFGLGGHPSARGYVESGVDVVVALGSSLGDLSTDGWSAALQAPRAFIQVDIDARQIGKSYTPTHAVVATCESFLGGLAKCAHKVDREAPGGVVRHALASRDEMIAPHVAIGEIQQVIEKDAIITVDSGEHFLFATHYLEVTEPDSFLVMTGLGSMGQSIGAAIGAQLARPDRTCAAIVGDGCFAMNAFEVATAVSERLPIVVFVFNDQRLGMVEIGHQTVYGRKPSYGTGPIDICQLAEGLGATVVCAERAGDILAARELIQNRIGPVVVEVRIDPDVRLPKKDRMGAFAPEGEKGKSENAQVAPPKRLPRGTLPPS
ncbi:MAG TPA: thiamine pyrophosphate-binding protein [Kofleriaceae bacterium]|nr:thiamine pyrophosphate-binding protein [Kofleriaceae bacterium]